MLRTLAAVTLVTLGLIPLSGAQPIRKAMDPEIETAVMRVLDDFLVGLNSGDLAGQQRAMHFPHYRLANGTMTVLDQRGNMSGASSGIRRTDPDWHHTKWDRRNIVGWSSEKVHLDTQFTRYRKDDTPIASYESLYVVTKEQDAGESRCDLASCHDVRSPAASDDARERLSRFSTLSSWRREC